ncbi:hypothetical protein QR680_016057 [Steinernema hermaphroditum]|uniref:BED-type domain-containing protein n=1 Tax=Steinernema hermaphroditum TaxID=289476 RepID=A0AA39H9W2_9BILA|nr:hypothetical protein QR680_016057 [Steinernema hermaphroditum]
MGSSIYDDFFDTDVVNGKATCKECKKILSRKQGSTSSILKHLELHHQKLYEKFQERKVDPVRKKRKLDAQTPSITAAFEAWRPGGTKSESINRALSLMIAVDSQPLSMVDRPGFRNFMKTVVPNYSIKSRTAIYRTEIPALYDEYVERVKRRMESVKYFSFTSDSWSSEDNKHSLLSLTAHWMAAGKLEYRILGVLPIHGRHTGENLSAILSSCLADFIGEDARKRTHLIVRDAATVMKKTTRLCGLTSVDCFAHKIQLAVYSGIKTVLNDCEYFDDVIERIKKFIRKVRKSGNDRDDFADLQKLEEVHPRWLTKGIDIRWFTSGDFLLVEKILSALKPMKQATVMLQGRQVTISVVVPTIYVLRRALVGGTELGRGILDDFEDRIRGIEDDPLYVVATMLDVRFKRDFIEEERKESAARILEAEAHQFLANIVVQEKTADRSPSPEVAINNNTQAISFFEQYRSTQKPDDLPCSPPIDEKLKLVIELQRYLAEPAQPSADPVLYWFATENVIKFPTLSLLAQKFLSSPATSVESERLFSTASLALTELRRSMAVESLQKLLFLKLNVPLEGFFA